jgi:recombination protein RecA
LKALAGRCIEISSTETSAALSFAFRLTRESQQSGEPACWICGRDSAFFPPDAERTGVDLGALPVVWSPRVQEAAKAADILLRSGAFGLLVLDLGARYPALSASALARLAGLAKKHKSALACLTEKEEGQSSLGSLVSLRGQALRTKDPGGCFACAIRILKDKNRGPGWKHVEVYHGPDGLY